MVFHGFVFSDRNDLAEGPRNDSLAVLGFVAAHHGMGLTAACLSIGEDGAIVAIEYAIDEGEGALLVDEALGAVRREDIVKREALGLLFTILSNKVDLIVFGVDLDNAYAG